jgi:hypothetical protein
MGGDLNLKKSWHPALMTNQRKVWEEEKKALQERKRIDQMMKERAEERQQQELQEMQEAAGGKKRLNRVDWMYNGPSTGQTGTTEEMEGYLLGKRRIDTLLKDKETKRLEKANTEESFMALQKANTARDVANKVRDDPLLAIKRQEEEILEAMMKDPVKRKALLKAAGREEEPDSERKHRKHRHHGDRDRDSKRRYRHDRSRSRSPRRRSDEEYRSRRKSSPPRRRNASPYDDYRNSTSDRRRRSRSPYSRKDKDRSPHRYSRSPDSRTRRHSPQSNSLKHSKSWHGRQRRSPSPPAQDDRAAKLAAMQQAASELDKDRDDRLKAIAEREANDLKAEEAARARSSKYGGKGDFLTSVNRRAGELGVGERIQRGRVGYEKDTD